MSFSVYTNIAALNSQSQLERTNLGLETTLARLSLVYVLTARR